MEHVKKRKIVDYSSLELAYLGDAVWELAVREYFINFGYGIHRLNKLVKEYVNAVSQSNFLEKIIANLSEEELSFIKRAKNSNIKSFPKSCSVMEYKNATAFEAYIARLYLLGEKGRIEEILKQFVK